MSSGVRVMGMVTEGMIGMVTEGVIGMVTEGVTKYKMYQHTQDDCYL